MKYSALFPIIAWDNRRQTVRKVFNPRLPELKLANHLKLTRGNRKPQDSLKKDGGYSELFSNWITITLSRVSVQKVYSFLSPDL